MSVAGVYKLTKMMAPVVNPGPDEEAFKFVSVEEQLEYLKENDPDEVEDFEQQMKMHIVISEDGKMVSGIPIPEDAPAEEIKRAEERGRIFEGHLLMELHKIKLEGDDVFMFDPNKMLTGEEWIKITTDTEGELNLVMMVYNKIV